MIIPIYCLARRRKFRYDSDDVTPLGSWTTERDEVQRIADERNAEELEEQLARYNALVASDFAESWGPPVWQDPTTTYEVYTEQLELHDNAILRFARIVYGGPFVAGGKAEYYKGFDPNNPDHVRQDEVMRAMEGKWIS